MRYANVIVNISQGRVDRTFSYIIPPELENFIHVGSPVRVPFGRREIHGYVIGFTDQVDLPQEKMREILCVDEKSVPLEDQLIRLALWMKETYGCTMNQALKTVLPTRRKVKKRTQDPSDQRTGKTGLAIQTGQPAWIRDSKCIGKRAWYSKKLFERI